MFHIEAWRSAKGTFKVQRVVRRVFTNRAKPTLVVVVVFVVLVDIVVVAAAHVEFVLPPSAGVQSSPGIGELQRV